MSSVATVIEVKSDSIFRPALFLMSGKTLAFAATFFIPIILARIFEPAQFGTYKQLFLIQSTAYYIAQAGMATSLYYFLPGAGRNAGRYVANSFAFLALAGLLGFGGLVAVAQRVGRAMNNDDLARHLPWMGTYLLLMMLSAALEMVLISRSRYKWASATYALSDLARAAALVLPALMFRQLDWLLKGAVVVAAFRALATIWYFRSEFPDAFKFDASLFRDQLAYALPLGLAVLVEILQGSLPQYLVSYLSSPATFAIFAVGCLQIPLVEFAASPTSDVMMVRMQECLTAGRRKALLGIWHDATWKLALLFCPLAALMIVDSREIIALLFGPRYAASAPLFGIWSFMILLTTLQVDGVMRVFAKTRLILYLNLMRLALIAMFVGISLRSLGLLGPVIVIVLANLAFKIGALARIRSLLEVPAHDLLPWRRLAGLIGTAILSASLAWLVKSQLHGSLLILLASTTLVHVAIYSFAVWNLDLLYASERSAITDWMQNITTRFTRAWSYGKG